MNRKIIVLLAVIVLLVSGGTIYHFFTVESAGNSFEKISAESAQERTSKNENVIIYYSSKDCSSCKMYSPILESISNELSVKVYQLDAQTKEKKKQFIDNYNLYSTPTLLLFKDGEITRFEGILTEEETRNAIGKWKKQLSTKGERNAEKSCFRSNI